MTKLQNISQKSYVLPGPFIMSALSSRDRREHEKMGQHIPNKSTPKIPQSCTVMR